MGFKHKHEILIFLYLEKRANIARFNLLSQSFDNLDRILFNNLLSDD
jgi:hypothetical protein